MAINNAINADQTLATTSSPTFVGLSTTTASIGTATLSSGTITSAPAIANDIVNKAYADSIAGGLTWQAACVASTTANLTATYSNGAAGVGATLTNSAAMVAFSTDGVSPAINSRILVQFQTASEENGIYTLTTVGSGAANWVLTRATDYDTPAQIQPGDIVPITSGTLYTNTTWIQVNTVTTIGTDPIAFTQFSYNIQPLDKGGTSASLTASNGGIFYSTASAGAILAGTATANQMLQSGATAAPSWSTSTWPATTTINRLLFSSAANTVSEIATANNGTMVTSSAGVPSVLAGPGTTGNILQSNAAAAPSFSTATYPSVASSSGTILRADGTNWLASGSTFANTYSASSILYSNGANTVTGLATANNGVLVTSATGVPSISTTTLPMLTDWVAYTPTLTGFGTASSVQVWSRRVGDTLEVRGRFTSGTSTATEARMTLGFNGTNANVSSSSTKISSIQLCGPATISLNGPSAVSVLAVASSSYVTFGISTTGRTGMTSINGSLLLASGDFMSFTFAVPIETWP